MAICESCGAEIEDDFAFCPRCGAAQPNPDAPVYPSVQRPEDGASRAGSRPQRPSASASQAGSGDKAAFGWAVLGFFIPLAGLVIYLVWKDKKPKTAMRAFMGAFVGLVVQAVVWGVSKFFRGWLVASIASLFV